MVEYAIIDNQGIIENFHTEEEAHDSIDRIREEMDNISGDLKVIQILGVYN